MRDQPLTQPDVDPGQTEEELSGLLDTAGVALSELSHLLCWAPPALRQLLEVAQCEL